MKERGRELRSFRFAFALYGGYICSTHCYGNIGIISTQNPYLKSIPLSLIDLLLEHESSLHQMLQSKKQMIKVGEMVKQTCNLIINQYC